MLLADLQDNFSAIPLRISQRILRVTEGMMRSVSTNTSSISRELSLINGKSFKTNDMAL
jgi:hypothetical protein